ncbi:MAG: helix-turn-helix transcriptional regulator [Armatimonadetes bacterium]|nr:helix-turn-helix transcriptional regulator [Armatimonadota bacterium]
MSFGENVRWLRKANALSQADLAAMIRVNHHRPTASYISRVEHGLLSPRLSTIRSLARALKVKPWQLVADIGDNVDFWDGYMRLSAAGKREVQRHIAWMLERGK